MEPTLLHRTLLNPSLLSWEDGEHVELLLQLTAPGPRRPPRTVVVALDASQAAFEPACRAVAAFADGLAATDRLALVAVSRDAVLQRPLVRVGHGHDVAERLHEVQRGAFANLSAGLARAVAEARRGRERAWRAAWERAHAVADLAELRGVLERIGPCDAEVPAAPEAAAAVLDSAWRLAGPQRRLHEAAAVADVLVVADGDPGRGLGDHAVLAGMAARARAHGVRTSTVATSDVAEWEERLAHVASAGGGRHRLCDVATMLEHDVGVVGRRDAEPIAAQAVTVTLRPSGAVGRGVDTAGACLQRVDTDDEILFDLGDVRHGETRQLGMRLAVDGRGRRRGRTLRGHRPPVDTDGAPIAHLELEWLVADDGALERVSLPVHRDLRPEQAARVEPARAWREPLPDLDWAPEPDEAPRDVQESLLGDGDPEIEHEDEALWAFGSAEADETRRPGGSEG